MNQRITVSLFLAFLLCLFILPEKSMADAKEKFLFFYANDIEGETEPCG